MYNFLIPAVEIIQRLTYSGGVEPGEFSFLYVDHAEPLLRTAAFDAPNTHVNGTQRFLVRALPQHRIAMFCYGTPRRLLWHRARRVDHVFGTGLTPELRLVDVLRGHQEWAETRRRERVVVQRRAREELSAAAYAHLRRATAALRHDRRPDDWVRAACDVARPDLVRDLVCALEDPALRDALLDALGPQDPAPWLHQF